MMKRLLTRGVLPLWLGVLGAGACGPPTDPNVPPTPSVTPTQTPSAAPTTSATANPGTMNSEANAFDPVRIGMTAESVTKLCDDHLAAAAIRLDAIRSLKDAPAEKLTFASVLGAFDSVILEVNSAVEFPYLMGVAHPSENVREAAKKCEPKTDKFMTSLWLDADVANVVKAFAKKGEALSGEKARLLADTLRDFNRNGLNLPPEKQARLRELNRDITDLGQKFTSNISKARSITIDAKGLDGLPPEYVAKHPPNAEGKIEIKTDYPDYFPFITYAKDRKLALDLYKEFTNRGGDENVKLLETLLKLRHEKAQLLGYPSWAHYAIEPRMAKTPDNVKAFLSRVRDALKGPAKAEMAALLKEHVRLGGDKSAKQLPPPDRYYLEDRVRESQYKLDSKALSEYFEVSAVREGLLKITSKMYGLEYKPIDTAESPVWHSDVVPYEVWSNGKRIGKFYFDLYSRPDKYPHAAMFGIRTAKRLDDGTYQTPIAALVCNFPKPGAQAALMQHDEVVTFFHEFGHVLHQMLTESELATYSGTSTVRDFVEAPSQMFEEWAWSREVLDLFARHHSTGEKIPDPMFKAMLASRGFGRALATQRQLFLAMLDLEYHSRAPGFSSTAVLKEVQNGFDSNFPYVEKTHFQSSFGHLIGYDAGYYSYQWALSLSRDILSRFRKEGMMSTETAAAWRRDVLSKGGGLDERGLVTKFLGREPSEDAYIAYLKGAE